MDLRLMAFELCAEKVGWKGSEGDMVSVQGRMRQGEVLDTNEALTAVGTLTGEIIL
jgi:hypothetical protein